MKAGIYLGKENIEVRELILAKNDKEYVGRD